MTDLMTLVDDDDPGEPYKVMDMDDMIRDIRKIIDNKASTQDLKQYLEDLESQMESKQIVDLQSVDKNQIRALLMKHPYFKNPSSYHIRLVTIMKYLKKKGVDTSIPDIDLLVDRIIQSIEGVEKLGYGRYKRKKL